MADTAHRVTVALRSPWPRLLVLVALLGGFAALALTFGADAATVVRQWAESLGPTGAVIFVLGYAVATVMLLPGSVFSAAAGALFGPALGVLVVFCGALLGCAASFRLGRVLGRDGVERLAGGRIAGLNALLKRRGIVAVVLVRLVPLFPFALVNYGFAVTSISQASYLVGSAVGMLPGIVAYVVLGSAITEPGSLPFLLAVGTLLLLAVVGAVFARRLARRDGDTPGRR